MLLDGHPSQCWKLVSNTVNQPLQYVVLLMKKGHAPCFAKSAKNGASPVHRRPLLDQSTADGPTASLLGRAATFCNGSRPCRARAPRLRPVEHLPCNLEYVVSQASFL